MIDSLHGEVVDKGLNYVVISCGGVGYRASAGPNLLGQLHRGETATIITKLVVREDSMQLFAFDSAAARDMFDLLQTVSGVGAKVAMAILSMLQPVPLATAIANSDVKTLQKVPGIGKRVADRIVVDLKEKVESVVAIGPSDTATEGVVEPAGGASSVVAQHVTEALVGLGFPVAKAESCVATQAAQYPDADDSQLLKRCLAALAG